MITFSCVHCGQRMKITEEDGSKKATCPECGQVVLIPPGEPSGRIRRPRGRSTGSDPGERSAHSTQAYQPTGAVGMAMESPPPIPETPTRVERRIVMSANDLIGFLSPPTRPDEIGRLGGYRVLEVIGAGGMGVVFRAEDPQLQRVVALKAMLPGLAASSTARQRFLREARAAAALQHDHIVTIYAVGEDRGIPFLAMPFLQGQTLDARLTKLGGPLPVEEILRIAQEIAEGLSAIHQSGLIHRDIKPANVWLEGSAGRVKILDFGLARATAGEIQLTQEGAIVGSPAFMAPEQASRQPVDARADLFGLGCVLYMMATGVLPFLGDDTLGTLLAVATADPEPPHQRNPEIPEPLSRLILKLLAKKPDDRPSSASLVAQTLWQMR